MGRNSRHWAAWACIAAFASVALLVWADEAPDGAVAANPSAPVAIVPQTAPAENRGPRANLRTDTTLVQINVTVLTPRNQLVTGLDKENFQILEDGSPQEVRTFSIEEAPLSVGLLVDVSNSMNGLVSQARRAASEFFRISNPEDEFLLVTFNDAPKLAIPWTRSTGDILSRMAFTRVRGSTALLDGVYIAMEEMRKAHNTRKAILILSDGEENSSRYTQTEINNSLRESDVQVYAIGVTENSPGNQLLVELARETGGRAFRGVGLSDLPDAVTKIGMELRSQYVLGYRPSNEARDGKYRQVEVVLKQPRGLPPLRAYYRTGYYAPAQ